MINLLFTSFIERLIYYSIDSNHLGCNFLSEVFPAKMLELLGNISVNH